MKVHTLIPLLLLCCLSGLSAQSGVAYHDALALSAAYRLQEEPLPLDEAVLSRLQPYFDAERPVAEQVEENPFLQPYFVAADSVSFKLKANALQLLQQQNEQEGGAPLGLSVTNLAAGFSQFLIERTREELTVAFFERFQRVAERNPEFQALFPLTTERLERLLDFPFGEMLPALRAAFQTDLDRLVFRLDNFFRLEDYEKLLRELPEVELVIRGLRLVKQLETGQSPEELLSSLQELLEQEFAEEERFRNVQSTLELANLFSGSLISFSPKRTWITFEELNLMLEDETALELYIGLIYQRAKTAGIRFDTGEAAVSFTNYLEQQRENLFVLENYLMEFLQLAEQFERLRDGLPSIQGNLPLTASDKTGDYLGAALDLLQHSFGLGLAIAPELAQDRYFQLLQQTQLLYRHLSEKAYDEAVLSASALLKGLLEAGDELIPEFEYDKKRVERIETLLEYGIFMANMVQASSPEEVRAAIGNAALPAGSSSVKKTATFSLTLQSYLGAHYRLDNPSAANSAWADDFGINAPIGLALSHGFGRGGSLSLFGAVFDLGAAVDYELRLTENPETGDTELERDYQIELGQILSPGGYLVYGAPFHLPLALGVGGQYGPGLSRITASNNVVQDDPSWRWQVFLAVDIPIFTLWNRGR